MECARIFLLVFCLGLAQARFDFLPTEGKIQVAPPYYSATMKTQSYILPILQYGVHLLSPYIDHDTTQNHYFGHHEIYRRKMNDVLKEWREDEPDNEFARESITHILMNIAKIPRKYFNRVINFGGGFINHNFYWGTMSPHLDPDAPMRQPTGPLLEEIIAEFESLENFKELFTNKSLAFFGSGYTWLVRQQSPTGKIIMYNTFNQDTPLMDGHYPILCLDLWEHAYYVKHQYRRNKHIEDWWWIVDWDSVQELSDFWRDGMKLSSFYDMPDISDAGDKHKDLADKVEKMLEEKAEEVKAEAEKAEEKNEL